MKEEKSKNPKALYCIHNTLSDSIFSKIIDRDTTKKASDKLKEKFKKEHKKKRKISSLSLLRETNHIEKNY